MNDTKLWMRAGDDAEYVPHESLDDVVLSLLSVGVTEYETKAGGILAAGYEGNNYISLYWGSERADRGRDLSDAEHALLRERLKG